jgi:hypothetical protein
MKLSLDALKDRAEAIASEDLLSSITGGLAEECHNGSCESGGSWWSLAWSMFAALIGQGAFQ